MTDSSVIQKLGMKAGQKVLVLNPPAGYLAALQPLPAGTQIDTNDPDAPGAILDLTTIANVTYDLVQLFCGDKAEIDAFAPLAMRAVKGGGHLWMCYPKGTSKVKTDINRDKGWDTVTNAGWQGVAQIAIDETWSALRFRPSGDVGQRIKPVDL